MSPTDITPVDGEAGVVTLPGAKAAAFLAWLPDSEIATVSVEVWSGNGGCALRVTPASAYAIWKRRYSR